MYRNILTLKADMLNQQLNIHTFNHSHVNFSPIYGQWRENIDNYTHGHYIRISKWSNDLKGYHSYIPKLKKEYFRFHTRAINDALGIFSTTNPQNHTMVSMHIRLDDYAAHRNKVFKIPDYVTKEYLRNAMEYFHVKYKVKTQVTNGKSN